MNNSISQAFLEIRVEDDCLDIPAQYLNALQPYFDSIPTVWRLPWPVDLIPVKGSLIVLTSMLEPFDEVSVEEVEYYYSKEDGARVYIRVVSNRESRVGLSSLLHASAEGMLLENQTPMAEVLAAAGLQNVPSEQLDDIGVVQPMYLDKFCRSSFKGTFLRPVELTEKLLQELFACLPKGMLCARMQTLFENQNRPTKSLSVLSYQRINQVLIKKPINGSYYRLARNERAEQLWEVEPPQQ